MLEGSYFGIFDQDYSHNLFPVQLVEGFPGHLEVFVLPLVMSVQAPVPVHQSVTDVAFS